QGIAQLEIALSSSTNLVRVQPYLDSLLRTLLSSERIFEVAELKREVLTNLISRLPLDNLEDRTQQILSGLCRQGNAGANRVCKALMQRLPAGTIVAKLTAPDYLHAKSSKFRDHALQMSIYSLMSFPGTCFDINILAAQVTYAALNRKRRVRQAALEVFAVLADICSVEQILQIVAEITDGIELGSALLMAVKKRLSRLQLPIITPDGAVVYVFHKQDQSSALRFGADVDWITQGEGSASPNAVKRRRLHTAHKKRIAQEYKDGENATGLNHSIFLKKSLLTKFLVIQANFLDRRLVAKACSESSMDGRSTDSTTTTCSSGSGSGSGSFIQLTSCKGGINRRLVRQNSRFPVVRQHTDFISNFMRSMQRTPYPYSFEDSKSSRLNDELLRSQKQHITKKPANLVQQNWMENGNQQLQVNQFNIILNRIKVEPMGELATYATPMQAFSVTAGPQMSNHNPSHSGGGSPLSVKSTNYSQKSTASAKSNSSSSSSKKIEPTANARNEIESLSLEQQFGELVVDDMEDLEEETESPTQEAPILRRNESVNSLQSKTESIKTQLEDATPQMSRAQSIKSLAIEEEIESSNSFVVVEGLQHALESTAIDLPEIMANNEKLLATEAQVSSSKKSDIVNEENRAIHSRSISMDSLYGRRPGSKQGCLDASTSLMDNNSSPTTATTCSQVDKGHKLPVKTQHTPLKQKAKTSYLLRGQRRISPVKQSIKMSPTELFPANMSKFEKPREALVKTFDQLDSSNWEVNVLGLKSMVRLIRYHSDFLDNHMHMTCIQLTRSVRNLRSQVARAACQAATELFTLKCKSLELECDDLVCALLHRSADTNRFLRADATHALESMVDHVQPAKVLNILASKGSQHQNAIVRTTTAKLLFRLVERLGCDRIYAMARENRDKFFVLGANLLLEGSLETRSFAKSLFRALSEHSSYQRLLLEVIPSRTYRNVEKALRSIAR
ncbi:GH11713, partial [Drosophila grimshawi]